MSWKDAVQQNRRDVMALTTPQMTSINAVLVEARERTAKALAKFLKENTGSEYQIHTHRALIGQLDDTLKLIQRELPESTVVDLKRGSKRALKTGIKNTQAMIREGEKKFRDAVPSLRIPVAKVLTRAESTLIGRHERQGSRYAGRVGDRIRQELAVGVIRGEGVDQMARRLIGATRFEHLKSRPSKVADAIADRAFFKNQADAERLVRTELANAYTEAQLESLDEANEDDPGWMKRWDAANDKNTCDICAALDDQIVGLHENFKGGVQGPPIHPNDRCCIVPHRSDWGGGSPLPGITTQSTRSKR